VLVTANPFHPGQLAPGNYTKKLLGPLLLLFLFERKTGTSAEVYGAILVLRHETRTKVGDNDKHTVLPHCVVALIAVVKCFQVEARVRSTVNRIQI
jgi:hypothetical protein